MKKGKPGQPQDDVRLEGFLKVVQYLRENDDEQVTIGDLVDKMEDYLAEEKENGTYTPEHMKKKLQEHFGEQIIISTVCGKADVVTLHTIAETILHDFDGRGQQENDPESEKASIIETAAKLTKHDIKSIKTCLDYYPGIDETIEESLNFLTISLITLTTTLDGKDTFHGMGILATVTPGTSQDRCVPRREVKREEILTAGKIEIKPPFENQQHQLQVMYKDMIVKTVEGPAKSLDILWKSSLLFDNTRPAWPGMMQAILSG
eukprot:gene20908-22960_t